MRTYRNKLEAGRGDMSQEMIRQLKNSKKHANTEAEKARRRSEAEQRNAEWNTLTDVEKLKSLKQRPGKCEKQIKKIVE